MKPFRKPNRLDLFSSRLNSVLIFPPVDNHKRFLIHSSVQGIDNLCSFSIGHGDNRRTVICDKDNLISRSSYDSSSAIISADSSRPANGQKYVSSQLYLSPKLIPVLVISRNRDNRRPDRPVYVAKARHKTTPASEGHVVKTEIESNMSKEDTSKKTPKCTKPEEEEEGDWDSMYADDGECLNPDLMKELTKAVRNVRLVPAPSVSTLVQEQEESALDEFSHVVEVSHFPPEFKTQDLMMLFMQYKESGFEIKWVDDTHALVVFSSARIGKFFIIFFRFILGMI